MNRYWWNRKGGWNTGLSTLVQRVFDWASSSIVVKDSPGQPRYYGENGVALAEIAVLASVTPVSFDAGFQFDDSGGTYVDYTAELASAGASDVIFFPAGVGADDAFRFGAIDLTGQINITVGTVGTGTYTLAWEYYATDLTWKALNTVTDGTNDFKTGGAQTVTYDRPTDAERVSLNGSDELFFIQAKRDGGSVTIAPLGTIATSTPSTVPHQYTPPNFFGAQYCGKIAVWWVADAPTDTADFEVWVRTDSSVRVVRDNPQQHNDIEFEGLYALVDTVSTLADYAETIVSVGYRPAFIRPTSTDTGTLRVGPT